MASASTCPYMADWKERSRRVFENLIRDSLLVWDSFLFLIASWARKDCTLSSFSFKSLPCNLRSILLSHENNLLFNLIKSYFADKKNWSLTKITREKAARTRHRRYILKARCLFLFLSLSGADAVTFSSLPFDFQFKLRPPLNAVIGSPLNLGMGTISSSSFSSFGPSVLSSHVYDISGPVLPYSNKKN